MRFTKRSGPNGLKESYSISGKVNGVEETLYTASATNPNESSSIEQCITVTEDGMYKITLIQSFSL